MFVIKCLCDNKIFLLLIIINFKYFLQWKNFSRDVVASVCPTIFAVAT